MFSSVGEDHLRTVLSQPVINTDIRKFAFDDCWDYWPVRNASSDEAIWSEHSDHVSGEWWPPAPAPLHAGGVELTSDPDIGWHGGPGQGGGGQAGGGPQQRSSQGQGCHAGVSETGEIYQSTVNSFVFNA